MADLGEDFELFEIFPRSPDTEIWYDARDVQAAPDDTQQSDDNVSNTSTTPDPDPVISEDSSRSASAISHLWQRHVVFGKDPTMADILTFLGFPLVILGAWAAVQAIRMAQWTQWKDSFEWCENVWQSIILPQIEENNTDTICSTTGHIQDALLFEITT
ncbi:hypothetical protein G7054_g7885 [Neopestalotiopsis clavispora]|nr:hypothetical protein G7054_g7885 [Neopestalotiopsis clavispora]